MMQRASTRAAGSPCRWLRRERCAGNVLPTATALSLQSLPSPGSRSLVSPMDGEPLSLLAGPPMTRTSTGKSSRCRCQSPFGSRSTLCERVLGREERSPVSSDALDSRERISWAVCCRGRLVLAVSLTSLVCWVGFDDFSKAVAHRRVQERSDDSGMAVACVLF
eukprot:COSAG02_NODE_5749_length_4068_cov_14.293525_1_plen_164_part_00